MMCVNLLFFYIVVVVLFLFFGVEFWVNDYDKFFIFMCFLYQLINWVVSYYDNGLEDCKFDFQCIKYIEGMESCFWLGMFCYLKMFDGNLIKLENIGNYGQ